MLQRTLRQVASAPSSEPWEVLAKFVGENCYSFLYFVGCGKKLKNRPQRPFLAILARLALAAHTNEPKSADQRRFVNFDVSESFFIIRSQ